MPNSSASNMGRRSAPKEVTSASQTQHARAELTRFAVRIDPTVADTFRLVVAMNKESINSVLTELIRTYIKDNGFDPDGKTIVRQEE